MIGARSLGMPSKLALLATIALAWLGGAACDSGASEEDEAAAAALIGSLDKMPTDVRVIETLAYNDANDMWRVWFAPNADGTRPEMVRLRGLRIAKIGDAQVKRGIKPHLRDVAGEPIAYLPSTFQVDAYHAVIERRLMPETNERRDVVVRYQRQQWQPLLVNIGAATSAAAADSLAMPAAYYPPVFTGRPLVGFSATGRTLEDARLAYRRALGVHPPAVRMEEQGGLLEDLVQAKPLAQVDAGPVPDAGPRPVRPPQRRERAPRNPPPPAVAPAPAPGAAPAPKVDAPVVKKNKRSTKGTRKR